jgi:hypothetical protein
MKAPFYFMNDTQRCTQEEAPKHRTMLKIGCVSKSRNDCGKWKKCRKSGKSNIYRLRSTPSRAGGPLMSVITDFHGFGVPLT